MTDLTLFILFVLGGNGGFDASEVPAEYQFTTKDGSAIDAQKVEAVCTGQCYDFWKAYAVSNEKQALEGGISDFIGGS